MPTRSHRLTLVLAKLHPSFFSVLSAPPLLYGVNTFYIKVKTFLSDFSITVGPLSAPPIVALIFLMKFFSGHVWVQVQNWGPIIIHIFSVSAVD